MPILVEGTEEESAYKRLKAEELLLLEAQRELRLKLPHLYGFKWYKWARRFFESTNKINLLCAANQISKSSTQIRKCIHWATEPTIWGSLWHQDLLKLSAPSFWYLYPSSKVVEAEFREKWKAFLPKDEGDKQYGWKEVRTKGELVGILFNTGVMVYFKTYSQKVDDLQSGTLFAIFCDEELPVDMYDELIFRLSASDGYFHMVFTATLGQDFWRRAMEPKEGEEEVLPQADKQCVSVFDCQFYEDGTASHWTDEKIRAVIAKCGSKAAELRRVWGRFVKDEGLRFGMFDAAKHYVQGHPLPTSWLIYAGVDYGSGGEKGHPSAICFIAVRPDYRAGRVFLGWRGDGIPTTTSTCIQQFIDMKDYRTSNLDEIQQKKAEKAPKNPYIMTGQAYDWSNADFSTIAVGMGEGSFVPADKTRDKGIELINTLFKNNMLAIYSTPELGKLATELSSLSVKVNKTTDKDDFTDALRYGLMQIPWDFSGIVTDPSQITEATPEKPRTEKEQELYDRRNRFRDQDADDGSNDIQAEFDEYNDLYGS